MNTGCIGACTGFLTKAAWVGALSLAACGAAWSQSADMLGVNYPANTRVEGVPLVLNGSGVNYRGMAKQYTLALYSPRSPPAPMWWWQVSMPRCSSDS